MTLPSIPPRFNLAHYFLDARIEDGLGAKTAVITENESFSYEQVQQRAERVHTVLREAGIAQEDRVLIACFDGIAFVEAFFGVLKAGAVFCLANPLSTESELDYLLEYTRCKALIVDEGALSRIQLAQHRHLRSVFAVPSPFSAEPIRKDERVRSWNDAVQAAERTERNADTLADDIAGWLFTSGTTGRPKGAVHLHRHFAFNTEVYAKQTLGLRQDDVFVSVSRLFFGYGTGTNLMFPFAVGGTAVLFADKPTPERLFSAIDRHGVTVLTNVPAMIRQMLDVETTNLSTLRMCLSAGEALPPELLSRWLERYPHAPILDGIGSAEMFHIYLTNKPGDIRPGSLGTAVPGYTLSIIDVDGNPVADGEFGRLTVSGDSTALCYWNAQDSSRETFQGARCITADLFRKDADGYYWYGGRVDDMLKVRGQFVSPLEIEDCLMRHYAVTECAVVPVPDDVGLLVPKAFVVLKADFDPCERLKLELQEFCKDGLTRYKFPREVVFLSELPRNDRGKILRKELR